MQTATPPDTKKQDFEELSTLSKASSPHHVPQPFREDVILQNSPTNMGQACASEAERIVESHNKSRSARGSTYFLGQALERCLNKNRLRQRFVAERSLVHASKISRIASGQIKCSPNDLANIIQAFPNPEDKADLIMAYIAEAIPSAAFNYISIERRAYEGPSSRADTGKGTLEVLERTRAFEFLLQQPELIPSLTGFLVELARKLKQLPSNAR
jgi:hypothetical protein